MVLAVFVGALATAPAATADPPPPGSEWHETYITEPDGTSLHADVLRPKGVAAGAKTPVILSIGPYFNHSGQTGPAGPAETHRARQKEGSEPPRCDAPSLHPEGLSREFSRGLRLRRQNPGVTARRQAS